jgi:hypothetical protein
VVYVDYPSIIRRDASPEAERLFGYEHRTFGFSGKYT